MEVDSLKYVAVLGLFAILLIGCGEHRISVTVLDPHRAPIVGIAVYETGSQNHIYHSTDASGNVIMNVIGVAGIVRIDIINNQMLYENTFKISNTRLIYFNPVKDEWKFYNENGILIRTNHSIFSGQMYPR